MKQLVIPINHCGECIHYESNFSSNKRLGTVINLPGCNVLNRVFTPIEIENGNIPTTCPLETI